MSAYTTEILDMKLGGMVCPSCEDVIAAALLAALLVGAGWNTFLPHVRFPLEGSHMYALW